MSVTNLSVAGLFDPYTRDFAPSYNVMAKAVLGVGSLAERLTAQNMILRGDCSSDFVVRALQAGSAATDTLIDLSAKGVTFPAQTARTIEVEAWVTGDAFATTEFGHIKIAETFIGGTPPQVAIDVNVAANVITTNTAGARGAFTTSDPTVQFAIVGNTVTVTVTNEGAAESNSWILRVRVGKLVPFNAGT